MTSRTVGGQTSNLAYDPLGELITASGSSSSYRFGYDTDGRRVFQQKRRLEPRDALSRSRLPADRRRSRAHAHHRRHRRRYRHRRHRDERRSRDRRPRHPDLRHPAAPSQSGRQQHRSDDVARRRARHARGLPALRHAEDRQRARQFQPEIRRRGSSIRQDLYFLASRYFDPVSGRFISNDRNPPDTPGGAGHAQQLRLCGRPADIAGRSHRQQSCASRRDSGCSGGGGSYGGNGDG